jgi:hypothetical protein
MMILAYFRELPTSTNESPRVLAEVLPTRPAYRTRPTVEDVRIHALLNERLLALQRECYGLLPKLLRFLRAIPRMPGRLWRSAGLIRVAKRRRLGQ